VTTIIYDLIMDELKDRHVYRYKDYAPFFISSFACHRFNLMNQAKRVYQEHKTIPNMRLHLLFVSPAGFMKSFFLKLFAGYDNAIFQETGTHIIHRQSMNEASLIGSTYQSGQQRIGIAQDNDKSIMVIEEFSGLTNSMKQSFNSQLESSLLSLLDSGRVYKDMASTTFDYDSQLTLWAAVQPTRFDVSSGLGRRFCYLSYIPTLQDNAELRNIKQQTRNMLADPNEMMIMREQISLFRDEVRQIEKVTFDESVAELYDDLNLFAFEIPIFDRLILGYNLARYGAKDHCEIGIWDKDILDIVSKEKEYRDSIQSGLDFKMITKIIEEHGGSISMKSLTDKCLIYGWNSQQLGKIVKTMIESSIIFKNRNMLEVIE